MTRYLRGTTQPNLKQKSLWVLLYALGYSLNGAIAWTDPGDYPPLNHQKTDYQRVWTVEEVVQKVLSSHPDLQEAHAEVETASYNIDLARRSAWPALSLTSGYSYSSALSSVIPGTNIPVAPGTWTWTGLAQLQLPIFVGGRISAEIEQNEKLLKSRSYFEENKRTQIIAEVREFGYLFLRDKAELEAIRGVLEFTKNALLQVHAKAQQGLATQNDELKTELQFQKWELESLKIEETRAMHDSQLKIYLQLPPEAECEIRDQFPEPSEQNWREKQNPMSKQGLSLDHRPDIQELKSKVEAFQAAEQISRSAYFPQISAFGNLGYSGLFTWNTGVFLQWQLFNWGVTASKVGAAVSETRASEFRLSSQNNQAQLDLKQAVRQLELSWKSLQISRKAEIIAEDTLRLARLAYEQGHLGIVQVLEAQSQLHQSRSARIHALADYAIAEVKLWKASPRPG